MQEIRKTLHLPLSKSRVYTLFVDRFDEWWPKEYTWSQDKLHEIKLDARANGPCSEIGPNGFRCDWGTIVEIERDNMLLLKWQISPQRVPVPDPDKASEVLIQFREDVHGSTTFILQHSNFEKHGHGAEEYMKAMNAEHGWEYILSRFSDFVTLNR